MYDTRYKREIENVTVTNINLIFSKNKNKCVVHTHVYLLVFHELGYDIFRSHTVRLHLGKIRYLRSYTLN